MFESKVNKFETDTFVKDPVVTFIEFDVIVLEFDINDDVVCKLPVLTVNDPEQLILFTLDIFVDIIIIRENYFSLVKRNVINIYLKFYQNKI